jgi:hypothetical protein
VAAAEILVDFDVCRRLRHDGRTEKNIKDAVPRSNWSAADTAALLALMQDRRPGRSRCGSGGRVGAAPGREATLAHDAALLMQGLGPMAGRCGRKVSLLKGCVRLKRRNENVLPSSTGVAQSPALSGRTRRILPLRAGVARDFGDFSRKSK